MSKIVLSIHINTNEFNSVKSKMILMGHIGATQDKNNKKNQINNKGENISFFRPIHAFSLYKLVRRTHLNKHWGRP